MRGDQYVNYSHITLKARGQHVTHDGDLADMHGVDMEANVNKHALSIPESSNCKTCCDNSRKICVKRLEAWKEKNRRVSY
jgi:hypothetical protein